MTEPYLTVVATARNDNHGGDLLHRIQVFVNGLAAQADRFGVPVELLIVEWNPPEDRPLLVEAITWPESNAHFTAHVVEVPRDVHQRLENGDRLPLFQMIAKNVGIRRARGRFVLATNVDVLLSDELMSTIARRKLRPGAFYRADRTDVDPDLDPFAPVQDQLSACATSIIRICSIDGTRDVRTGAYYPIYGPSTRLPSRFEPWWRLLRYGIPFLLRYARRAIAYMLRGLLGYLSRLTSTRVSVSLPAVRGRSVWRGLRLLETPEGRARLAAGLRRMIPKASRRETVMRTPRPSIRQQLALAAAYAREKKREIDDAWRRERARVRLHTNACGDFTLLAREEWARLGGYAELQMFSMHLDSLFLYEAYYGGLRQVILPGAVYHLEHGGGFRPDDDAVKTLNARLERAAIPQITNERFLEHILDMYARRAPLALNNADWGFANMPLPEIDPTKTTREEVVT